MKLITWYLKFILKVAFFWIYIPLLLLGMGSSKSKSSGAPSCSPKKGWKVKSIKPNGLEWHVKLEPKIPGQNPDKGSGTATTTSFFVKRGVKEKNGCKFQW